MVAQACKETEASRPGPLDSPVKMHGPQKQGQDSPAKGPGFRVSTFVIATSVCFITGGKQPGGSGSA